MSRKRTRADLAHLDTSSQEYKTTWQRIKRGSISWSEYVAKLRAAKAKRTAKSVARHKAQKEQDAVGRMSTKQYFSDMQRPRVIISQEILRSLGK